MYEEVVYRADDAAEQGAEACYNGCTVEDLCPCWLAGEVLGRTKDANAVSCLVALELVAKLGGQGRGVVLWSLVLGLAFTSLGRASLLYGDVVAVLVDGLVSGGNGGAAESNGESGCASDCCIADTHIKIP